MASTAPMILRVVRDAGPQGKRIIVRKLIFPLLSPAMLTCLLRPLARGKKFRIGILKIDRPEVWSLNVDLLRIVEGLVDNFAEMLVLSNGH